MRTSHKVASPHHYAIRSLGRELLDSRTGRRLGEMQTCLLKEVVLWKHGFLAIFKVRPRLNQRRLYVQRESHAASYAFRTASLQDDAPFIQIRL